MVARRVLNNNNKAHLRKYHYENMPQIVHPRPNYYYYRNMPWMCIAEISNIYGYSERVAPLLQNHISRKYGGALLYFTGDEPAKARRTSIMSFKMWEKLELLFIQENITFPEIKQITFKSFY